MERDEWETVCAYASLCLSFMEERGFFQENPQEGVGFWICALASLLHRWCSDEYYKLSAYHAEGTSTETIHRGDLKLFQYLDEHRLFRVLRRAFPESINPLPKSTWLSAKKMWSDWRKRDGLGEDVHPWLTQWWEEWMEKLDE